MRSTLVVCAALMLAGCSSDGKKPDQEKQPVKQNAPTLGQFEINEVSHELKSRIVLFMIPGDMATKHADGLPRVRIAVIEADSFAKNAIGALKDSLAETLASSGKVVVLVDAAPPGDEDYSLETRVRGSSSADDASTIVGLRLVRLSDKSMAFACTKQFRTTRQ